MPVVAVNNLLEPATPTLTEIEVAVFPVIGIDLSAAYYVDARV